MIQYQGVTLSHTLPGYIVGKGIASPDPRMVHCGLGNVWDVWVHPLYHVVRVSAGGQDVGFLIGFPIDIDEASVLSSELQLDCELAADQIAKAVLDRLSGSFLLFVAVGGKEYIYPDAAAQIGLVYERASETAASSVETILGGDYNARMDRSLVSAFDAERDGWFTAGLTAHSGINRLLPNHRLCLTDRTIDRFWPVALPGYQADPEGLLKEMADEIDRVITALVRSGPTAQGLTGGNESRALLACNRTSRGSVQFVTAAVPGAELDIHLAKRLVKITGIQHRVLPCAKATDEQIEAWRRGAGHAQSGMNALYYPTMAPLAGHYLIGGVAGEVGRGFFWPKGLSPDTKIDADFLVGQMKLPKHPVLLDQILAWLDELPEGLDSYQILDLAYLELRVGPWAFGQGTSGDGTKDVGPLISRRQFTRMLSMAPSFRLKPGFLPALAHLTDPITLSVPINKYGDLRDAWHLFMKLVRRPDRAWRKLKKIVNELLRRVSPRAA